MGEAFLSRGDQTVAGFGASLVQDRFDVVKIENGVRADVGDFFQIGCGPEVFDDAEIVMFPGECLRQLIGMAAETVDQRRHALKGPASIAKITSCCASAVNRKRDHCLGTQEARRNDCRFAAFGKENQIDIGESREVMDQRGDSESAATVHRIGWLRRKHQNGLDHGLFQRVAPVRTSS